MTSTMQLDTDIPMSIPTFGKRQRHRSRLSDDWMFSASFADEMFDDLPYCPSSQPMVQDMTPFQARTSTPFPGLSKDLFAIKSQIFQQDNKMLQSLSKVCLDSHNKSRDSGRWSLDSADMESLRNECMSLPRLSLENTFDKVVEEETEEDSAYESECFSQTSDCDLINSASSAVLKRLSSRLSVPCSDVISSITKQFSPPEPDRLIGRSMGRENVDIISELSARNMSSVLELICDNVNTNDLASMRSVCKTWKTACDNDKKTKSRVSEKQKQHKLSKLELQKENITVRRKSPRKKRGLTHGTSLLGDMQTSTEPPPLPAAPSHVMTRARASTQLWQEEASKLRLDESLRKCPQCNNPSRTLPGQDRAKCAKCQYDFCINCQCVFHGSSNCSITVRKKSKTDPSIGTRKSKKNLRRL